MDGHAPGPQFHEDGARAPRGAVFVFGSNLAGRHGAGAALAARKFYGAEYGVGVGPQGQSYAIPTKGHRLETLSLDVVRRHVREFIRHVGQHQQTQFFVTRVGCGLAGYRDSDIAPLFFDALGGQAGALRNCSFARQWSEFYRASLAAADSKTPTAGLVSESEFESAVAPTRRSRP